MMDVVKTPLKELLGLAIKAEIGANAVYTQLAERVSNPLLKEKFQWLAYEENKHRTSLIKIYDNLYKGEEAKIPEKTDDALLPSIDMSPSSSLIDILYQAMESEKAAENFYSALSQRLEDPQKKFLEYLSKVEHSHYMMLRSEYVLAQEVEDYAEKDIDKVIT
ncbi:MAG: ferritin family protein [Candidatus Aminicenantes bacterium]|nr:MAG: ferritin family protein [Candidatus Aminicenantes bacterium]